MGRSFSLRSCAVRIAIERKFARGRLVARRRDVRRRVLENVYQWNFKRCTRRERSRLGRTNSNYYRSHSRPPNAASIFNGEIDEVRIWGIDRSQIDIENSMHGKLHGFERGLMGSWSFDECAGLKPEIFKDAETRNYTAGVGCEALLVLFSHEDEERAEV